MDFAELRRSREALVKLLQLSHFDDDPYFHILVESKPPMSFRVKAPSRVVLEHALWRVGLDQVKVKIDLDGPASP